MTTTWSGDPLIRIDKVNSVITYNLPVGKTYELEYTFCETKNLFNDKSRIVIEEATVKIIN